MRSVVVVVRSVNFNFIFLSLLFFLLWGRGHNLDNCFTNNCYLKGASAAWTTNTPLSVHRIKVVVDHSSIVNRVFATIDLIKTNLVTKNLSINDVEFTNSINTFS